MKLHTALSFEFDMAEKIQMIWMKFIWRNKNRIA